MPKLKPFRTEADLCAAFIAAVGDAWTSYAETAGWDLLLVRNADGFQIGIQAKLKLNPFVLAQALETSRYAVDHPGPDCRAVLVPSGETSVGLSYICAYIGITIIRMASTAIFSRRRLFDPELPELGTEWSERDWYEQAPAARCKLPEYVPDVRAGASSPVQLTSWKIGALKIVALLDLNGFVTRADFRNAGIDFRRWTAAECRWLRVENGRFIRGDGLPDFKGQHPVVFAQIQSDVAKWKREEDAARLPL